MYKLTKRLPKLAGLALVGFLAACSSDRVSSPVASDAANLVAAPDVPSIVQQEATVATQVELPAPVGRHGVSAMSYPAGSITYQFWVDPTSSQSFTLGTHMVKFPAYTICDPATSGYGPQLWQTSCSKLRSRILITATTFTDANGRPQIDFWNDLRFYPNFNNQLPAVYLRDPSASATTFGRIDYCITGGSCINEAASDPTLATKRDPWTGYLFRLVRHFSGYNVWA